MTLVRNTINLSLGCKKYIGISIVIFLIFYLIWEIYWYINVGLNFISWHTHFMFYLYLWILSGLTVLFFFKNKLSEKIKLGFLTYSAVIFSLFLVEIYLGISGENKTYLEKISGHYISHYYPVNKSYYHTWPSDKEHWLRTPEYSYWRPTNSLGFPDEDWMVCKKSDYKRILALGDSFTEGDGASYDSSYVSILKNKLIESDKKYEIMNAGVCGSDPLDNYINLRDRLISFQPDIIFQTLTSSDLTTDIIIRGGMKRFLNEGKVKYTKPPWWEPIYAISYISRIFFQKMGYNELLRKNYVTSEEKDFLDITIKDLIDDYTATCVENQIKLYIVLRPDKHEIEHNNYSYDFSEIMNSIKKNEHVEVIDLLPCYTDYLMNEGFELNDFFWKQDGHHNSRGYKMMADCIYSKIFSEGQAFIEE